ncbi:MAG: HlyC/CorC family transporter [Chloroflexi bacterium]|nr:MAG: HlyC/CorC family transporter [Chloroflexota bacterium]TMD68775.1 MAG: HlyC/CorC family transporter [Chloroflexota bacterium]
MDTTAWLELLIIVIALILAALAASAETSLTSISRVRLRTLVEQKVAQAILIERLHREPNAYLSTILIFNTVAIIVASSAATLLALHLYQQRVAEWLISLVLSLVVLVFCEITPKTLALQRSERVALRLARLVAAATWLMRPVVYVLSAITRLILLMLGGRAQVRGPFVTEEELKMLVSVGEEEGVLEEEEREMIHGIFEMGDMRVREVMVPRTDLVAIEVNEPVEKAVELVTKHGHTRIPVYDDNLDHIIGVLYAKDLLRAVVRGEQKTLRDIARKPYFTPESNKVQDVLRDLRKNRVHMAIVVDEYGGTAGAVTIEDIIEEIVGPIQDEYDIGEEDEIQFINPNEVVLDGRVSVDDVNELLKLNIAADDYDTIGGYVLNQLGAAPKVGATLKLGNAELRVEAVQGTRIKKVRIRSETPFQIPEPNEGSPTLSSSPQPVRRGPAPKA